ncbi:unnamed protein product [Closterium sp. NIES-54]
MTRVHSPPIWNVNALLPGNPDVHIHPTVQPTAENVTDRGRQPQENGGRGSRGRGNGGRASGGRGNRGRANGGRANGGRANGGRPNRGRANGGPAAGGAANAGATNRETDRNGSGGEGEGARDKDDDEDEDDDEEEEEGDGWNDDDENYLENSLSALDEDEADDNDQVRGTRMANETPIDDWNRLGVDDTLAAKREMCMGILYGLFEATLKKYRGWANEYKRFMAHKLLKLEAGKFGEEAVLKNKKPDEIGAALE